MALLDTSVSILARSVRLSARCRRLQRRCYADTVSPVKPTPNLHKRPARRNAAYVGAASLLTTFGWLAWDASQYPEAIGSDKPQDVLLQSMDLKGLLRSYLAFAYLSVPQGVRSGESSAFGSLHQSLTDWATSNQLNTGENVQDTLETVRGLNENNIGAIISLGGRKASKETGEAAEEAALQDALAFRDRLLEAVEAIKEYQNTRQSAPLHGKVGLSFKMSGLIPDSGVLSRRSKRLAEERKTSPRTATPVQDGDWEKLWSIDHADGWQNVRDVFALDDAYEIVREVIKRSRSIGLDVYLEREEGEGQPRAVMEVLTDKMMTDFNKPEDGPPVLYTAMDFGTILSNRRLAGLIARASRQGYALGLRLEQQAKQAAFVPTSLEPEAVIAVEPTPSMTERFLGRFRRSDPIIKMIEPDVSALFMINDADIIGLIQRQLEKKQAEATLSPVNNGTRRLAFAQPYGQADALTSKLIATQKAGAPTSVIKILACGPDRQMQGDELEYALERSRLAKGLLHKTLFFWQ